MSEPPEPPPQRFSIETSADVEAGVYADFAALWHTKATFVLDFAALKGPPQPGQDAGGNMIVDVLGRVVARVRMPPQQVFELMKALQIQLAAYEEETGQRPSDPPITI